MKICATTLGETAGDLLSLTLKIGYAITAVVLLGIFGTTLIAQLATKKYIPVIYWAVILATSTAGTAISDFMDRTLGLGYTVGSLILATLLMLTLLLWKIAEKSLSVTSIKTTRGEIWYWVTILISNTLGTALGDFLADDSGLGFFGSAIAIASILALLILLYYFSKINRLLLFWAAFILTRPFGATFGDLLTKPKIKGGLDFGTIGSSVILLSILSFLIVLTVLELKKKEMNQRKFLGD
jgi:uncharacterized membrane-anchored protein